MNKAQKALSVNKKVYTLDGADEIVQHERDDFVCLVHYGKKVYGLHEETADEIDNDTELVVSKKGYFLTPLSKLQGKYKPDWGKQ